jgi:hypothetical protein
MSRAIFYPKPSERGEMLKSPLRDESPENETRRNQPLGKLQSAVALAMDGLSSDQLSWHPPGKWCATEVLEHLYLTYSGTIKGCDRVLAAGKVHPTAATWWQRVAKIVVIGFGHMPSGRESPERAKPRGLAKEVVLAEIVPKIAEMDESLSRCAQKFGTGPLLDHPIIGPLTAAEWKIFHFVHGMHHVKQIHRLREGATQKK